ncbi:E3 ubiquitin/ISG15 ligase TRIM25-like [Rana temporaria]|uniref:E3 ubiquitin/ISG15 ligase TRIM25-like n=1 Tax=Rana temporaria TaxID=8407 RepID=UPI001AACFA6F|nr:E3 ubiquitin/ISG15 ligase TRIM25-like [Rana temporaria]
MASSRLKENLECSVCLNIYTDPVTLKCGHNFCRVCIDSVLNTQEGSGGYSCPECREVFQDRPALHRNITLRNIVENFLSTHPDPEESGVFCTYCIHTPVPAAKSCRRCEAYLCDNHLRVHSKSPEHVLCDPTSSLENRKCLVLKKILEYYCTEDSSCICVSCRLNGEHRGHQVEALDEASEKREEIINNAARKLREEMDNIVQSLQEHRREVQGKADGETKRVTDLFRDLMRDPQKPDTGDLCDTEDGDDEESDTADMCHTEDGDDEDKERHNKLLHDGGDMDVAGVSHTGLSETVTGVTLGGGFVHLSLPCTMSGVNVEKYPGTHVHPCSTTEGRGHINAEPFSRHPHPTPTIQPSSIRRQPNPTIQPSSKRPQPSPTIRYSHCQAEGPNNGGVQQTSGVTGILLDVSTAANDLEISSDRKTASWTFHRHPGPETPKRFQDFSQVMSRQSFSSGRHSWMVDVGRSGEWGVGMCYPSIDRGGDQSLIGYNKKSWAVGRWCDRYLAIHDSKKTQLPNKISSCRVRIELDYEAGRISFYDRGDPIRHLRTIHTTFTEPLHAVLYVWGVGGGLEISGGNPM